MKAHLLALTLAILLVGTPLSAQVTQDILGVHDLSTYGPSPIRGGLPPCLFCHAPHSSSGQAYALWSEKLSTATYSTYTGTTNPTLQPSIGSASNLCLSCHDGTVAIGQTTPYGRIRMSGQMNPEDITGTSLQSVHPFNFQLPLDPNTPNVIPSVIAGTGTADPAVKLVKGNVECTTCHEPHNQFIDNTSQAFLVTDNTNSALCMACHVSNPGGSLMSASPNRAIEPQDMAARARAAAIAGGTAQKGNVKSMDSWATSIHATATNKVGRGLEVGAYGSVAQNGCMSCHKPHNAAGGRGLLTGPAQSIPDMDSTTQSCASCHRGGNAMTPAPLDVFAEFKKTGHPFPSGRNTHTPGETGVLNNNRHATCVDCHDPHASKKTDSFQQTALRPSQSGVAGVSAGDGHTVLAHASNQYETCLRCHGTSAGKEALSKYGYLPTRAVNSGDPLNLIPEFASTAPSSHPVMHDRNSALPQPSLLEFMVNLDGRSRGRTMGSRILCSDCHSSDDTREFGGNGPAGPHGSQYPHILERRYEMSHVASGAGAGPGSTLQNLCPNPSIDGACNSYPCASPYALCAKCHDLRKVTSNVSFSQHARHINDGFSCSVCHSAHGVNASSGGGTGQALVNFDANVVATNGGTPVTYIRGKNTCALVCHSAKHNLDGTVTMQPGGVSATAQTRAH